MADILKHSGLDDIKHVVIDGKVYHYTLKKKQSPFSVWYEIDCVEIPLERTVKGSPEMAVLDMVAEVRKRVNIVRPFDPETIEMLVNNYGIKGKNESQQREEES